ncbi:MAG TPA: selenocysteine-specific translation elongation factor [Angustibacter sp.]|nr:selenocysteine-specific translation elongation factor [Angustibacter sp.]
MHVLATAGHVDHGKSTLVKALTGMEPDRFAEEQRRGLTIDLGFVWATIDGEQVAIVDVPGHERFVPTMLAGVGPVPAALLVVAADEGWMPQTQEHLDALDAFGVRHGLLVVTRSDLADPAPARAQARERLAGTGLADVGAVAVSARTGAGLDELRTAIAQLVRSLPRPDTSAPVRLWVDRSFTVRGAGTVVTGTLSAGTLRTGDRLDLPCGERAVVRGLQSLGVQRPEVPAVARVAVNLRGTPRTQVQRGDALTAPGRFLATEVVDVRCTALGDDAPARALLHLGSAQVEVHLRHLGDDVWRLRLERPLPLRLGDVGLLRDPGRRAVLSGLTVLDVDPPTLRRRGAATARAAELKAVSGRPDAAAELARRGVVRRTHLLAMGVPAEQVRALPGGEEWLVAPARADELARRLVQVVETHDRTTPLDPGLPVEAARAALDVPATAVVEAVVRSPLRVVRGRVVDARRSGDELPAAVLRGVEQVAARTRAVPLAPPDADELRGLGLGPRELAAAVRAGRLVEVAPGVVLAPEGVVAAARALRGLDAPFTVAAARDAWGTSRRVAVPLLELLDRRGVTRRLPDDRRALDR